MQTGIAVHDTDEKPRHAININPNRGRSRKEKQMNAITKATSVTILVMLGLTQAAQAAEPPKPETQANLDKLVGQPVDLSPWAYAWRADREVQEKPEACFIPRRLKRLDTVYRPLGTLLSVVQDVKGPGFLPAPKGRLLSGLLWLAPVPAQRIELRWPEGSAVPPLEAIEVRVYRSKYGWFGVVWGLMGSKLTTFACTCSA